MLEPDVFPVGIPAALQNHHRDRAREYVDAVPVEPRYPNGGSPRRWPRTGNRPRRPWKRTRPVAHGAGWKPGGTAEEEAAAVMGTHLAATGEIDRSDVSTLRERGRSRLASFEADWAYRASSPVDAAVVHATLEEYIQTCRSQLHTNSPFPADPGAAVFQAGDVVGTVDGAIATATDAGRLREQYRSGVDGDAGYRQHLASAASRLDSLSRTTSDLDEYVDVEPDEAFDDNLSDTPAETLFRDASRTVEWRREQAEEARQRHDPATAVPRGRARVRRGRRAGGRRRRHRGRTVPGVPDRRRDRSSSRASNRRARSRVGGDAASPRGGGRRAGPALASRCCAACENRSSTADPERVFVQAVYAEAQARAPSRRRRR